MTLLNIKQSRIIGSLLILASAVFILIALIIIDGKMNPTFYWDNIQINSTAFSKYEKLVEAAGENEGTVAVITDLYFNDEKLIYDQATNTFYYSVIDEENGTTPVVTLASSSFKNAIVNKGPKISVYSEDGYKLIISANNKVSISDLVFTTLPVMNINISAESVENLGLDDTYEIYDYESVDMTLFDNSSDYPGASRVTESAAKIHMRGGTTIGFPQKSYRLSLLETKSDHSSKTKKNLLSLREDDDWILYSAYSDYEKLRTVFSMNLWHDMASGNNEWNAPVSNEYKYIELFINNRYHGLYALTYPIDNKQFILQDGENLFKKKDWSGTEFSLDLEPTESGELWLPGYSLMDGDMSGFHPLHNLYYQMAYSEDPDTIRDACDIDNAIDLWLFYKLTQAVDNVYTKQVKNLYAATKFSDDGIDGYKILFAPWDMDQTFGNRYVDGEGSHGITSYYNSPDYDLPIEWSPVYFLMECGDTEIVSEVQARYSELRNTLWSDEVISSSIASYENDIYDSGAFNRTMDRWSDGNYYDENVELDDFEAYVLERLEYMDEYIENL